MTDKIDDGGPAFAALAVGPQGDVIGDWGMTLRDYFASQAIRARWDNGIAMTAEDAASMAYQLADAVIAARKEATDG